MADQHIDRSFLICLQRQLRGILKHCAPRDDACPPYDPFECSDSQRDVIVMLMQSSATALIRWHTFGAYFQTEAQETMVVLLSNNLNAVNGYLRTHYADDHQCWKNYCDTIGIFFNSMIACRDTIMSACVKKCDSVSMHIECDPLKQWWSHYCPRHAQTIHKSIDGVCDGWRNICQFVKTCPKQYVFFEPDFAICDISIKAHFTTYANVLVQHMNEPNCAVCPESMCATSMSFWGRYYDPLTYIVPPHTRYPWLNKWNVPFINLHDYKGFDEAQYAPQFTFTSIMKSHTEFMLSNPEDRSNVATILNGHAPNFSNLYFMLSNDPRMDYSLSEQVAKHATKLYNAFRAWYTQFLEDPTNEGMVKRTTDAFKTALRDAPGIEYSDALGAQIDKQAALVVRALSAMQVGDHSEFRRTRENAVFNATKIGTMLDHAVHAVPFTFPHVVEVEPNGKENDLLADRTRYSDIYASATKEQRMRLQQTAPFWRLYRRQHYSTYHQYNDSDVGLPFAGEDLMVDLRLTSRLVPNAYSIDKRILSFISEKQRKNRKMRTLVLLSDRVYKELFTPILGSFDSAAMNKAVSSINTEEQAINYFASRSLPTIARNNGALTLQFNARNRYRFSDTGEGWMMGGFREDPTRKGKFVPESLFNVQYYLVYSPKKPEIMMLSLTYVRLSREPAIFLADIAPNTSRARDAVLYSSTIAAVNKNPPKGVTWQPWPKALS